jgi:L-alanine-DL-glutamate epimerase-like enolase superfamily enzyme
VRIVRVLGFRLWLPFAEGSYGVSGGRTSTGFDSTVVAVHTDVGIVGWGEAAPLGSTYDPAFAAGARAGLAEVAPAALGLDPRGPAAVARALDRQLKGHPYAKSALDMACWDAAGKAAGLPLAELFGGRFGESVALYRAVAPGSPAEMAARACEYLALGVRRLQVKVGNDPDTDLQRLRAVRTEVGPDIPLFVDANGGWTTAQARRFLLGLDDEQVSVEQPCASLEECAALRPHCPWPLVLDESIDSSAALVRAYGLGLVDGVTIKIARVGGITHARFLRDLAVALRIPVTVECTGGAEIDTAAIAQLSLSTPEELRIHTVDFHNWVTVSNATGMPSSEAGRMRAPDTPGLGVEPRAEVIGEPFLDVS